MSRPKQRSLASRPTHDFPLPCWNCVEMIGTMDQPSGEADKSYPAGLEGAASHAERCNYSQIAVKISSWWSPTKRCHNVSPKRRPCRIAFCAFGTILPVGESPERSGTLASSPAPQASLITRLPSLPAGQRGRSGNLESQREDRYAWR